MATPVRKKAASPVKKRLRRAPVKKVTVARKVVKKKVSAASKSKPVRKTGSTRIPAPLRWLFGLGVFGAVVLGGFLMGPGKEARIGSAPEITLLEGRSVATPETSQETWGPYLALIGAMAQPEAPDVGGRIGFWSDLILNSTEATARLRTLAGQKYIADVAPLMPEKYDCTTYVETVLSLARSQQPDQFFDQLMRVRYRDGQARFASRNHFPEADWIPNNIKNGVLEDVTDRVGQSAEVTALKVAKVIKKQEWITREVSRRRVDRALASIGSPEWQNVRAEVAYLPIQQVRDYMAKIPNGSIVNVVHSDTPARSVLITHQGFVLQKEGRTYFRHANPGGQIRTDLLTDYVKRATTRASGQSIVGLNFVQVRE